MGHAKERWMRLTDLGLTDGDGGNVCGDCTNDHALAAFVAENASENSCDYCDNEENSPIAIPVEELAIHMAIAIHEQWTLAVDELPYDGREGGYQGETLDAHDLLHEVEFSPDSQELFDDIASHFMWQDWCRKDYFSLTESQRGIYGWGRFCAEVTQRRRYTFWNAMEDGNSEFHPDYLPPGRMMDEIAAVIDELALISEYPAGFRCWRSRIRGSHSYLPPADFTAPPFEYANQPNRMSPAGIPMFYGARDFETSVKELSADPAVHIEGVIFESTRPLRILDLVNIQRAASYFEESGRIWWKRSAFLRFFAAEVSRPIERDARQHLAYVPTQVFTEYVRYHVLASDGNPVDGIAYRSSVDAAPCYVLFFDQDECLHDREGKPQSLRYVAGSLRSTQY